MNMVWKIVKAGLVPLALLSLVLSCTRDQNIYSAADSSSTSDGAGVINLNLTTKSVDGFLGTGGENLKMYLFNRDVGADNAETFVQDVELTYVSTDSGDNNIGYFTSESVPYGNYYMVLVAEDASSTPTESLTAPVHSTPRVTLSSGVMYTMPDDVTSCLQFFYGISELTVDNGEVTTSATMKRNQAKVSIRIKDTYNLMSHEDDNTVTVTLKNVPSTLNWEGKLVSDASGEVITIAGLPSQTTTSGSSWSQEDNVYVSESVVYVIPAHRNSNDDTYDGPDGETDYLYVDITTTDKTETTFIRENVKLVAESGIDNFPTANQQVLYNLIPTDESVTVEASLLDWDVEDTQTEEISAPADLDCIVMKTSASSEVLITDVYKEWNFTDGAFYNNGNYPMSTTTAVVAEIISNTNGCINKAQVINRYDGVTTDDWSRAVLWVQSTGNEGSAVVGIKLQGDSLDDSVNGGYRWKWHVLVSDTASECDNDTHATNASNANRSSDF